MQKHDVRKQQWEMGESLISYLQNGKVLTGNVNEIIKIGDIHATSHSLGKFLQRAESLQGIPFHVRRTHTSNPSGHRCTYRITLRNTW